MLVGVPGSGLRRELLHIAEAGLGQPIEELGLDSLVRADLGQAPPRRLAGDAVEAHQLVEAPGRSSLGPSELEVEGRVRRRGRDGEPAIHRIGEADPEVPLERLRRMAGLRSVVANRRDRRLHDQRYRRCQRRAKLGRSSLCLGGRGFIRWGQAELTSRGRAHQRPYKTSLPGSVGAARTCPDCPSTGRYRSPRRPRPIVSPVRSQPRPVWRTLPGLWCSGGSFPPGGWTHRSAIRRTSTPRAIRMRSSG